MLQQPSFLCYNLYTDDYVLRGGNNTNETGDTDPRNLEKNDSHSCLQQPFATQQYSPEAGNPLALSPSTAQAQA